MKATKDIFHFDGENYSTKKLAEKAIADACASFLCDSDNGAVYIGHPDDPHAGESYNIEITARIITK